MSTRAWEIEAAIGDEAFDLGLGQLGVCIEVRLTAPRRAVEPRYVAGVAARQRSETVAILVVAAAPFIA